MSIEKRFLERAYNKRFKRDFQRVAFLLCVDFGGYGVMRKLGSSVVSPLSGRYALLSLSKINIQILIGKLGLILAVFYPN
ncbi:hypothetical protein [Vibrio metschnikovii]|uniref:hypothetical protein n=1 Tax=Vibrio metschnikovii TaxID=28172 RepID=UPI00295EFE58|nr:DUF3265 domain-containing protein [Vibrio metschnikovii]